MAGRFSVEAVFKAVDKMTAPVTRMQNRVGKFTRSASRGISNLNRRVGKMVKSMGRGALKIAKFGGAILAAAGTATVVALNRVADSADALAKQSRRLDFPIEELQEWKFAAEQSGIENGLLDNSLGAFSKRLGEAKSGMGPLTTGLKKLNPQLLEQLNNSKSVSDAFGLVINAMRNAKTATEKAAIANAAFSRAGLKLANIADNSATSIAALRLEQRQNGNVTMAQAKAAEAYNDAVNSLKKSLMGLLQGVLLPMMPAITETLKQWREWIVANKDLVRSRVTGFLSGLKDQIMGVVNSVVEFNSKYNIGEKLNSGIEILKSFASFLEKNGVLILKLLAGFVAFSAVLKTFTAIMAAVNIIMALNPFGLLVLGIAALVAGFTALVVWIDDIAAGFGKLPNVIRLILAPIGLLIDGIRYIKNNIGGILDRAAKVGDAVGNFFRFGGEEEKPKVKEPPKPDARGITAGARIPAAPRADAQGKTRPAPRIDTEETTGLRLKPPAQELSGIERITVKMEKLIAAQAAIKPPKNFEPTILARMQESTRPRQEPQRRPSTQMVSPQERTARSIQETRQTNTSEVTIRDETGRAEVTRGTLGPGLNMARTGTM